MRFSKRLQSTAAIIRVWNNPFIEKQVRNLLSMGLGRVTVVVNATPDKGATEGYLGDLLQDPRVKTIKMFEGYTWCNALNRALMSIYIGNLESSEKISFVFNVSTEANFEKKHLEAMIDVMSDDETIGAVGTSFQGRQKGNIISLGRSYRHGRNTGMLIRLSTFGTLFGQFDPWCDDIGGMEDIDFILRMLALSELRYEHSDLMVPLVVGVNYHQPTKEKKEKEAMDKIIARWRSYFPEGSSERSRIDGAIKKMGLEEE